ncbi:hypothetical protein SNE510_74600 [Streptomyces sp. NE5-10]|nr:hypothetical protein SNE510_74600 [Streptomyces sp. NE5-10]
MPGAAPDPVAARPWETPARGSARGRNTSHWPGVHITDVINSDGRVAFRIPSLTEKHGRAAR